MRAFNSGKTVTHYRDNGSTNGQVIVFANSLGTDLRLWHKVIKGLPQNLRIITYDKRGHGLSKEPVEEFSISDLAKDVIDLLEYLQLENVIFVGISIGGMIAQAVAFLRPDLVSKLVLCDTATKIGANDVWEQRISSVKKIGIRGISASVLERWFSKQYLLENLNELELLRRMLHSTSASGYINCCKAIGSADLTSFTSKLKQNTLLLVGENDISTPPSLVSETAKMINRSKLKIIKNSGHLPCIDNPKKFNELLSNFLQESG